MAHWRCGVSAVLLGGLVLAAAGWLPAAAGLDRIEFNDPADLEGNISSLEGTILALDDQQVTIEVSYGEVSFPRARIRAVFIDFPAREAALDPADAAGHYQLAVLAEAQGDLELARRHFARAAAGAGAPEDAWLRLARVQRQLGDLAGAYWSYNEHRLRHGENPEVSAALEEIVAQLGRPPPPPVPSPTPAGPSPSPGIATPTPPPAGNEFLEADARWSVKDWGFPATVGVVASPRENNRVLVLSLAPQPGRSEAKIAVERRLERPPAGAAVVCLDFFNNTPAPLLLSLAFTDRAGNYYETPSQRLSPGAWQRNLNFDLRARNFKTKDTNWRHEAPLAATDQLRSLLVIVDELREPRTGSLLVDNLRLE